MLPAPLEYRFVIDGEPYLLVEWTRGGERRLRADYAIAIAAAPGVIENMDGANLYTEAVARECLKEAPAIFWEELPAQSTQNGQPRRMVSVERVPRQLWEAFRQEVDAFLALLFPDPAAVTAHTLDPGEHESAPLAPPEAVSPVFRGRAE